jgi:integrase
MPLAAGREAAMAALRDIGAGIDPRRKEADERRAQELSRRTESERLSNTFGSTAEEFIARHAGKRRRGDDARAAIRRELISRWEDKPVSGVTKRDVVTMVEEIADSGRVYAARKAFEHANKFYNWLIARGTLDVSPCATIRMSELVGRKEPRQRVLSDSEIRAVWTAAESLGYPVAPFVRLLLILGQRLREVAGTAWNEIDLDKALWTVPLERMKGANAHEVPLPSMAVEVLKDLPRWAGGPFVFSTTGGKRPISGFSKIKLRVDGAMPEPVARAMAVS